MRVLSSRLYKLTRSSQQATDELAYVVEENALAHRMVRLHGAQARQGERFDKLSVALRRLALEIHHRPSGHDATDADAGRLGACRP